MAYEPTNWQNNDVITAEKLNKLEQGVKNEQIGPQGPKGENGAAGPAGEQGIGIKTITGSINGSNELTLTFTLTNDDTQTVTGTITPPA